MTTRGWQLVGIGTAVMVALAVAGWVLFSGDDTTPVEVQSSNSTLAPRSTTAPSSAAPPASTTSTSAPAPAPTQPIPPPPPPPPAEPFTVAVTGDSMSRGILTPIWYALQSDRTQVDHQEAGGFLIDKTRVALDQRNRTAPPDVYVMLIATWENAALQSGETLNPADPAWPQIYRRDFVEPWVRQVAAAGSEVIWVGMPLTRHAPTSAQNQQLNAVWRDVAAAEPNVTWVDGPSILAGPDGGYLEIDTAVSPPLRLFNLDGLHLCQEASRRLTNVVLDVIDQRYGVQANPGWEDTDWRSDPEAYKPGECPAP